MNRIPIPLSITTAMLLLVSAALASGQTMQTGSHPKSLADTLITWSDPVQLSPAGGTPRIAVQGDTLHVTWEEGTKLPYKRSMDDGLSWEQSRNLWQPDSFTRFPYYQMIVADRARLYLFYRDHFGDAIDEDHAGWMVSSNGGETWSERRHGLFTTRQEWIQAASVRGNDLLLAFSHLSPSSEPYIMRSINAGEEWSMSLDSIPGTQVQLTLSDSALHYVHQPSRPDILAPETEYRKSRDLGDTWEIVELLSENDGNTSGPPSIGSSGNRLWVSYRDAKYGCSGFGCNILARKSIDGGTNWMDEQMLTEEPFGYQASIAIYDGVVAAAWFDDYNWTTAVKVRVSLDGGRSWGAVSLVGPCGSWLQAAVTERAIHIVYGDGYCEAENFNIKYVRGALPEVTRSVHLRSRWNMVSVPVRMRDRRTEALFPSAMSPAFTYRNGQYEVDEVLEIGRGYWLRFPEDTTITMSEVQVYGKDVPLQEGWNMIGSIGSPVPAHSIETYPAGIIRSSFFAYEGNYVRADTLYPGKSYWVKASRAGRLMLEPGRESPVSAGPLLPRRAVWSDELPPPPPESPSSNPEPRTPLSFSLEQNYPNPFNPATSFRFQVSRSGWVSLKVYDGLGREVAVLVNGEKEPGYYEITWDASNMPGGVYYVKMQAGMFTAMRVAVLVK